MRIFMVMLVVMFVLTACTLVELQTFLQCPVPELGADVVVASGPAAGTRGIVLNVQQLAGGVAVTLEMADGTPAVLAGCFEWVDATE